MRSRNILMVGSESAAAQAMQRAAGGNNDRASFVPLENDASYEDMLLAVYRNGCDGIVYVAESDNSQDQYLPPRYNRHAGGLAALYAAHTAPLVRSLIMVHEPALSHLEDFAREVTQENIADRYAPHVTSIRQAETGATHGDGVTTKDIATLGHAILASSTLDLPPYFVMAQPDQLNPYGWEPAAPSRGAVSW